MWIEEWKGKAKKWTAAAPYLFFAASVLIFVLIMTQGVHFYGSTLDWETQHTVIPDHLRELFYSTGVLFPQFDSSIGAGQNIYYLVYYGYLNPLILFSYLLPFVPMTAYLSAVAILAVISSVSLLYCWLKRRYEARVAFFAALLFEFATPVLFQSHRQIMFMMYLPFLVLALIGADRHLEGKSPLMMIAGIFLMILTSFYFSVGGIAAVVVYLFIAWIRSREELGQKLISIELLRKMITSATAVVTAVLMAGFLLIPELVVIRGNRTENNASYTLSDLLIPDPSGPGAFYGSASMGLTAVFAAAVIVCVISGSRWKRVLGIFLALISCEKIFIWVLNGGMYVDSKVLIPFLPLAAYALAEAADQILKGKVRLRIVLPAALAVTVLVLLQSEESWFSLVFCIDMLVTMLIIAAASSGGRRDLLFSLTVIAALVCGTAGMADSLVEKDESETAVKQAQEALCAYIEDADPDLYRIGNLISPGSTVNTLFDPSMLSSTSYLSVSSGLYSAFSTGSLYADQPSRNGMIHTQSAGWFMNLFMGNKYMISTSQPAAGYQPVLNCRGITMWKNSSAFPLAYAVGPTIRSEEYAELTESQKAEALMTAAVTTDPETPTGSLPDRENSVASAGFYDFIDENEQNIPVQRLEDGWYELDLPVEKKETVTLLEKQSGKALLVSLNVDNGEPVTRPWTDMNNRDDGDVVIWVNGQKNKLTSSEWAYYNGNTRFEYVITSDKPIRTLTVTFGKGRYRVSDFEVHAVDMKTILSARKKMDALKQVKDEEGKTVYPADLKNGVILNGTIHVSQDGYFVTTIPYDDQFTFYVDGKETPYYLTNEAFMGFAIAKGDHTVKAVYRNRYAEIGGMFSLAGLFLFFLQAAGAWIFWRKERKTERRIEKAPDPVPGSEI